MRVLGEEIWISYLLFLNMIRNFVRIKILITFHSLILGGRKNFSMKKFPQNFWKILVKFQQYKCTEIEYNFYQHLYCWKFSLQKFYQAENFPPTIFSWFFTKIRIWTWTFSSKFCSLRSHIDVGWRNYLDMDENVIF